MKNLLTLILLQISFLGLSQTTTFNEGWDTEPKKLLSFGSAAIVFEANNPFLSSHGKLLKYQVNGDEFEKVREIWLDEILIDYRFDSHGKLQLIGLQANHCDYYDSSDFTVYTIDTGSFTVDTARRTKMIGQFTSVSFANDSVIILTDNLGSKLYSLTSNQIVQTGLDTKVSYNDYVQGIFGGKIIVSWYSSFLELEEVRSGGGRLISIGWIPHAPANIYSYSSDSILVVTDSFANKLDTLCLPVAIPIPYHQRSKILNDKLYLLNDNVTYTYTLPDLTLISTDTLKGLPAGFHLADVTENNTGNLAALAGTSGAGALNQLVLKQDIGSVDEIERNEVSIDSMKLVNSVPYGNSHYSRKVTFNISCSNNGSDTIQGLKVLYTDKPFYSVCLEYRDRYIPIQIPPGESRTFDQEVQIGHSLQKYCFYVSAPGQRLENVLTDNSICETHYVDLTEEPLTELDIYPNPSYDIVKCEGDLAGLRAFNVYNVHGEKVHPFKLEKTSTHLILDLSPLSKGVYLIHLELDDQTLIRKIIRN